LIDRGNPPKSFASGSLDSLSSPPSLPVFVPRRQNAFSSSNGANGRKPSYPVSRGATDSAVPSPAISGLAPITALGSRSERAKSASAASRRAEAEGAKPRFAASAALFQPTVRFAYARANGAARIATPCGSSGLSEGRRRRRRANAR
jgi:hypothetical protein